jgi:alkylhydroperoxidase family enzyme
MAKKFAFNKQSIKVVLGSGTIDDSQDRTIVNMVCKGTVTAIVTNKGWTSEADLQAFWGAGFTQKHYLELILVVTIKTLSNYINHQTKPEANTEWLAMTG